MARRERARRSAALGVAAALFLAGCGKARPPLRIGTNSWPPCEIWQVAKDQGFFGDLPVEIVRFSAWSDNMSALYRGNLDITHATYFNAVYYQDKGEPGRIFLVSETIEGSDGLVLRRGIDPAKGLRGAKVAVEINTDEHFLLNKALGTWGLGDGDVEIHSTTSVEAAELFERGQVDACFTYEPYLSRAAAAGGTIAWTTKELPGYMIDVLVGREESLRSRSKDFVAAAKAWYAALEYLRKDPRAFEAMSEAEGMSAADFQAFFESFTFFSPQENRDLFASPAFEARLDEMGRFMLARKAIGRQADSKNVYTAEIIAAVK